jgi:hypothetical protein
MPISKGNALFASIFAVCAVGVFLSGCGADFNEPCGLGAPKGALRVASEPAGASIVLNGTPSGVTTNATLGGLLPGTYVVRVEMPGYAASPDSFMAEVTAEDTALAVFSLAETGTGRIAVSSDPTGAAIYLDGTATGTVTPDTLETVVPGDHTVRVSLVGYVSDPESSLALVAIDSTSEATFQLSEITKRLILVEHFSNTSCDPCYQVEVNLELAVQSLGFGTVVTLGNHLNWPSPVDPFYLANAAQENQRRARFNVVTMPHVRINGALFEDADSYEALLPALQAAAESPPYFAIDVHAETTIDSFVISGTVKKTGATPEGDEVLIAVIIETSIQYDAANGLDHYDDILRRFLPGTAGEPFTGAVGEPVPYRFAEALSGEWNADNLEAVVFLESNSTRKVYQAGSTRTLGKPHGLERKDGRR